MESQDVLGGSFNIVKFAKVSMNDTGDIILEDVHENLEELIEEKENPKIQQWEDILGQNFAVEQEVKMSVRI